MPDTGYLLTAIGTAAAITFALRALPFLLPRSFAERPLVAYLRDALPVGVVLILAVYCLVDIDLSDVRSATAQGVGAVATIGVHLWRRNLLLSLLIGTVIAVTLANLTW